MESIATLAVVVFFLWILFLIVDTRQTSKNNALLLEEILEKLNDDQNTAD